MSLVSDSTAAFYARHYELKDVAALAARWHQLETQAEVSIFLSWQWIGTWVETYPLSLIVLEIVDANNDVVGLALLKEYNARRHGVMVSRSLLLHQSGAEKYDQIWIEYNGLLTAQEHQQAIEAVALAHINSQLRWDEWIIGGIEIKAALRYATQLNMKTHISWAAPCYGVDLSLIKQQHLTYRETLSANTRYQINRAQKMYERSGQVILERPQSTEEALTFFAEIGPLHIKRWRDSEHKSGFLNPEFVCFHQKMIQQYWPHGVDLVKVKVNGDLIACFYNLLYRNRVFFYLSGMRSEVDNKLKPGLLSHSLCIENYLEMGFDYYDFMGGEERYKAQLGDVHQQLVKIALQRPKLKFFVENLARDIKNKLLMFANTHKNVSNNKEAD